MQCTVISLMQYHALSREIFFFCIACAARHVNNTLWDWEGKMAGDFIKICTFSDFWQLSSLARLHVHSSMLERCTWISAWISTLLALYHQIWNKSFHHQRICKNASFLVPSSKIILFVLEKFPPWLLKWSRCTLWGSVEICDLNTFPMWMLRCKINTIKTSLKRNLLLQMIIKDKWAQLVR